MNYVRSSVAFSLALALAACGGGGGGGVGSTPPPPAPTPSPTPAQTNSTLTNLTVSETFQSTGARVSATANAGTGTATNIQSSDSNFGGAVSIAYDAVTNGYTVRSAGGDQTFLPAHRDDASNATLTIYERVNGARADQLVLFNPGANNPQLALTYTSYGAWQTITENATSIDFAQQFFVYGVRQPANQPSTGSANYTTRVDGFWTTTGGLYSLGGTSSFSANFANMTVATSLNLTGTNVVSGGTRTLGQFDGTGTIAATGGGFNGTFQHQGGGDQGGVVYNGGFNGAFFGPQGQEMGYSFRLTSPSGTAVGAVVGKAN